MQMCIRDSNKVGTAEFDSTAQCFVGIVELAQRGGCLLYTSVNSILQVENLTKSFGDLVLFENISLGLSEGQRVGLIAVSYTHLVIRSKGDQLYTP